MKGNLEMSETDKEVDVLSGVETTGHSWDGIKELNNPLPRWWLYIWYGTIFWAILYMIAMPALPSLPGMGSRNTPGVLGMSDRVIVMREGRIAAEFEGADLSPEHLVRAAAGITEVRT